MAEDAGVYRLRSIKAIVLSLAFVGGVLSAFPAEWKNLERSCHVTGPRCGAGYLRGKVVLVCTDPSHAGRLEDIWRSFRSKPFVVIGSFAEKPSVEVSFPVYAGAELATNVPPASFYAVDETGKIAYRGADERLATETVVTLLTDMEVPADEQAWRRYLDYEFAELPGQACIRYLAFRKKFPESAKDYAERFDALLKLPEIKKLVGLVRLAKNAKDSRPLDPETAARQRSELAERLAEAIERYSGLKDSENALIAQEAKNALADLVRAKAALAD